MKDNKTSERRITKEDLKGLEDFLQTLAYCVVVSFAFYLFTIAAIK